MICPETNSFFNVSRSQKDEGLTQCPVYYGSCLLVIQMKRRGQSNTDFVSIYGIRQALCSFRPSHAQWSSGGDVMAARSGVQNYSGTIYGDPKRAQCLIGA